MAMLVIKVRATTPEIRRMVENPAGSINPLANASRQMIELEAKAINASPVYTMVII
ncbi:MAG: hypothetical protein ACXAEX_23345 [Promethearchaeota archaeon]